MEFLRISVEAIVGFGALFLLTKLLGKTQISQITVFDFISAIVLGELVGNALYDPEIGISKILFAVTLWGLLIFSLDIITLKFRRSRKFLEGMPSLIIRRGKIQHDQLKKSKLDLSQMLQLLREKDVFSLSEVEYAIFEPSGTINVLKKHQYQTPTNETLNVPQQEVYLPTTIISDGHIIEENLREIELNENQLILEVQKQGYKIEEIMYGEYEKGKGLFLLPYA